MEFITVKSRGALALLEGPLPTHVQKTMNTLHTCYGGAIDIPPSACHTAGLTT
jgi:hypothetical protein